MSFREKILKSAKYLNLIRVVTGTNNGKAAWWIINIAPSKLELYKADIKAGDIELDRYGEILHKGWGIGPSEELIEKLQKAYS